MLHPFVKLLTGWISDKATRDIIAQCYNIRLMWSLKACHYYSLPLPCLILTDMFSSNKSFILFCQRIMFLSTKNIYYWCIESKFDTYSKDMYIKSKTHRKMILLIWDLFLIGITCFFTYIEFITKNFPIIFVERQNDQRKWEMVYEVDWVITKKKKEK